MQNFNSKVIVWKKMAFMAIALNFIVGCDLPSPQKNRSEEIQSDVSRFGKTYYLDVVSGQGETVQTDNQVGLPNSKIYHFSACLKDKRSKSSVRSGRFQVLADGKGLPSRLDTNGCIIWDEKFIFSPIANSKYFQIQRKIKAQGFHQGVVSFNLAINPWVYGQKFSEVIDTYLETPSQMLSIKASKNIVSAESFNLNILEARATLQEVSLNSNTGGVYRLDLRLTPQIQVLDKDKQALLVNINSGKYRVTADLLNTSLVNGKSNILKLNREPIRIEANVNNQIFMGAAEFNIPIIPTRGRIELALSIQPLNDTSNRLIPFQGIFILGEFNDIKGSFWARLKSGHSNLNSTFDFDSYQQSTSAQGDSSIQTPEGFRSLSYEIEPLTFRFTRIGEETALKRVIHFQVRACIKNGGDGSPVRDFSFTVKKQNGETAFRRAEYDSCIYWDDSIQHNYYDTQKFVNYEASITNTSIGVDEKMSALISPWDIGASRDSRTIEKAELESQKNSKKAPAQVVIESYRFNTLSVNYNLDNLFNLTMIKKVNLILEPQVLMYSSLDRGLFEKQPLRDGYYLLSGLVRRNDYEDNNDQNRYLTSFQKIVKLSQGRISAQLELVLRDFNLLSSRNQLIIELQPVDPQHLDLTHNEPQAKESLTLAVAHGTGLEQTAFMGPILLSSDDDSKILNPSNEKLPSIEQIMNEGKLRIEKRNKILTLTSTAQAFADVNALQYYGSKDPEKSLEFRKSLGDRHYYLNQIYGTNKNRPLKPEVSISEINTIIKTGKMSVEFEDRLCNYWFNDLYRRFSPNQKEMFFGAGHQYFTQDCMNKARKNKSYFQLEKRFYEGRVKTLGFNNGSTLNLNVGTSFSVSRSNSTSTTRTTSFGLSAGISQKFFEVASIGASVGYSISKATAETQSSTNSTSVGMGTSLLARRINVKFQMDNAKQCIILKLAPEIVSGTKAELPKIIANVLDEEKAEYVLNYGILLCDESPTNDSILQEESYYFINQDIGNSGPIDSTDIRNKPFVLNFRGENSFSQFISLIGGEISVPHQSRKIEDHGNTSMLTIRQSMQHRSPVFPGFYLLPAQ